MYKKLVFFLTLGLSCVNAMDDRVEQSERDSLKRKWQSWHDTRSQDFLNLASSSIVSLFSGNNQSISTASDGQVFCGNIRFVKIDAHSLNSLLEKYTDAKLEIIKCEITKKSEIAGTYEGEFTINVQENGTPLVLTLAYQDVTFRQFYGLN